MFLLYASTIVLKVNQQVNSLCLSVDELFKSLESNNKLFLFVIIFGVLLFILAAIFAIWLFMTVQQKDYEISKNSLNITLAVLGIGLLTLISFFGIAFIDCMSIFKTKNTIDKDLTSLTSSASTLDITSKNALSTIQSTYDPKLTAAFPDSNSSSFAQSLFSDFSGFFTSFASLSINVNAQNVLNAANSIQQIFSNFQTRDYASLVTNVNIFKQQLSSLVSDTTTLNSALTKIASDGQSVCDQSSFDISTDSATVQQNINLISDIINTFKTSVSIDGNSVSAVTTKIGILSTNLQSLFSSALQGLYPVFSWTNLADFLTKNDIINNTSDLASLQHMLTALVPTFQFTPSNVQVFFDNLASVIINMNFGQDKLGSPDDVAAFITGFKLQAVVPLATALNSIYSTLGTADNNAIQNMINGQPLSSDPVQKKAGIAPIFQAMGLTPLNNPANIGSALNSQAGTYSQTSSTIQSIDSALITYSVLRGNSSSSTITINQQIIYDRDQSFALLASNFPTFSQTTASISLLVTALNNSISNQNVMFFPESVAAPKDQAFLIYLDSLNTQNLINPLKTALYQSGDSVSYGDVTSFINALLNFLNTNCVINGVTFPSFFGSNLASPGCPSSILGGVVQRAGNLMDYFALLDNLYRETLAGCGTGLAGFVQQISTIGTPIKPVWGSAINVFNTDVASLSTFQINSSNGSTIFRSVRQALYKTCLDGIAASFLSFPVNSKDQAIQTVDGQQHFTLELPEVYSLDNLGNFPMFFPPSTNIFSNITSLQIGVLPYICISSWLTPQSVQTWAQSQTNQDIRNYLNNKNLSPIVFFLLQMQQLQTLV